MKSVTFSAVFEFIAKERRPQSKPRRQYRNPVTIAEEWRTLMVNEGFSRADLARKLGVSRARVTQVMRLLDVAPEITTEFRSLGDPLPAKVISERTLRPLVDLPVREQKRLAAELITVARDRLALVSKGAPAPRQLEPRTAAARTYRSHCDSHIDGQVLGR